MAKQRRRRRVDLQGQRDRGYPGKRKAKVDRLIEEAAGRARLLAALPAESATTLSPPAIIDDERFADAVAIWRVLVPELQALNFFNPKLDRYTFSAYCLLMAEYFEADRAVRRDGYWFMRRAIAGGTRPWKNPDVERRDNALKMAMDLAREFALTPVARSKLERIHSGLSYGPLFGRRDEAGDAQTPASEDDAIGIVDRLRSVPPTEH